MKRFLLLCLSTAILFILSASTLNATVTYKLSYNNLTMLFIGIEIMSVSLYILAGINKSDFASNEASLKYFLMGAFSTGFLLLTNKAPKCVPTSIWLSSISSVAEH